MVDSSLDGGEVHTILGHFDLTLTSDLISRFLVSNVSFARPIPLGAFVTLL